MKKRNKRIYDDDDGRVISPMNVDGMPWHGKTDDTQAENDSQVSQDEIELTAEEKRAMTGGVFAAALLVAGVFILAGFLFILFCVFIWLK